MFWYENMIADVKWGSERSNQFGVPLGVKQGGINSPDFFSLYFDDLTKLLRKQSNGCHIGNMFLASIFYADDICLLAPTRSALQRMIQTCANYCKTFGLSFNPKKSKIMIFSKTSIDYDLIAPIYMNGLAIDCTEKIKYLGTTIVNKSGLSFSAAPELLSFYRSVNSILNVINKTDEVTQMHLLFSNCVPILSHACAIKEFSSRELLDCNTAVNDAIRKIFSFHRWESVRDLRSYFGYKSLTDMFSIAKAKFENALLFHANPVLSSLQRFILASREQSEH